jgi:hypothetical protein
MISTDRGTPRAFETTEQTTQDNETDGDRSAGAITHGVPPGIGSNAPFIGDLLRLVRLRSRKAVAGEVADVAISPQGRRPDHASDAARSSMEAGITRGASLLFGGFGSWR